MNLTVVRFSCDVLGLLIITILIRHFRKSNEGPASPTGDEQH